MTHTLDSLLDRTEESGECLLWLGAVKNGMPCVWIGSKNISVRQLILQLAEVEREPGCNLLSSCHDPMCVEPAHIVQRPKGTTYRWLPERRSALRPVVLPDRPATPWTGLGA